MITYLSIQLQNPYFMVCAYIMIKKSVSKEPKIDLVKGMFAVTNVRIRRYADINADQDNLIDKEPYSKFRYMALFVING